MERRYFQVRQSSDASQRFLEGHISVFDQESEDLGGFTEVIRKGAFASTLANGNDVKAFFNHDPGKVLGTTKSGTLKIWEDDIGLAMRLDVPFTSTGNDLLALVHRGDLPGCSFGFLPDEESIKWIEDRAGMLPLREVNNLSLFEVSVGVTYPAYADAEAHIALRSLQAKHDEQDKYSRKLQLIDSDASENRYITKQGSDWVVHAEDGKVLGKHKTKAEAVAQLQAVEISKQKKSLLRFNEEHDKLGRFSAGDGAGSKDDQPSVSNYDGSGSGHDIDGILAHIAEGHDTSDLDHESQAEVKDFLSSARETINDLADQHKETMADMVKEQASDIKDFDKEQKSDIKDFDKEQKSDAKDFDKEQASDLKDLDKDQASDRQHYVKTEEPSDHDLAEYDSDQTKHRQDHIDNAKEERDDFLQGQATDKEDFLSNQQTDRADYLQDQADSLQEQIDTHKTEMTDTVKGLKSDYADLIKELKG